MADDSPSLKRPNRRRRVIVTLLAGVIVIASWWLYGLVTQRSRLVAAIEAAGGRAHAPNHAPFAERILQTLFGDGDPQRLHTVELRGPVFDDAWLNQHHDMRSVAISQLIIVDTAISRQSVLRLLSQNPLTNLHVPGIPLTDADAALIGRAEHLEAVSVMQSEITDAGLAALQPQQLVVLNVAGTRVTSAALCQHLAGSKIQHIGLDGRQFTPELAAQLGKLKTVHRLILMGPDVTDPHLKLLETVPGLFSLRIDQSAVSETAVATFKAAHPKVHVDFVDAKSTYYKWRDDR